MNTQTSRRGGLALCGVLWAASAASAPVLPWLELEFRARKALVLGGHVTLSAELLPWDQSVQELPGYPDSVGLRPEGRMVLRLLGTTRASFHGESATTTWLDPSTGGVIGESYLRQGRVSKRRRYGLSGVHQWKSKPASKAERGLAPGSWSDRQERSLLWPEEALSLPITQAHALLYQASVLVPSGEGGRRSYLTYTKGRAVRVELVCGALETVVLDLETRTGRGEVRRVKGRRQARSIGVTARPADGVSDDSLAVSILGMSSGLVILVEPETGLPLELRGDVAKLGALRVRLVSALLPGA